MPGPMDGGLAFPSVHREANGSAYEHDHFEPGMTLRDYFAGQALAGLAIKWAMTDDDDTEIAAAAAYMLANAMLKEREAK